MNSKGLLDCFVVGVGDLVRVEFTLPTETQFVRVTEVKRIYGMTSKGTRKNPLVTGINTETNERAVFDASFVKEILERRSSKVKYPNKNIFRVATYSLHVEKKGKQWTGTISALTVKALAKLPYEFDRPLDENQLIGLFFKTGIGCKNIDCNNLILTVDERRFCRWVSKNHTRIVMTSRAYDAQITMDDQYLDRVMNIDLDLMDQQDEWNQPSMSLDYGYLGY